MKFLDSRMIIIKCTQAYPVHTLTHVIL